MEDRYWRCQIELDSQACSCLYFCYGTAEPREVCRYCNIKGAANQNMLTLDSTFGDSSSLHSRHISKEIPDIGAISSLSFYLMRAGLDVLYPTSSEHSAVEQIS